MLVDLLSNIVGRSPRMATDQSLSLLPRHLAMFPAQWLHKLLMALGTAMLMVSIVLLGNVGFEGQTMVGASYIVANGAYWLASIVFKEHYWDLSRYDWRDVTPRDARQADRTTDPTTCVTVTKVLRGPSCSPSGRRRTRVGRRGVVLRPARGDGGSG